MRTYVICDAQGKVIGTAPIGEAEITTSLPGAPVSKKEAEEEVFKVQVVPEPLRDQTIYEVELPSELASLEDGAELPTSTLGISSGDWGGKAHSGLIGESRGSGALAVDASSRRCCATRRLSPRAAASSSTPFACRAAV